MRRVGWAMLYLFVALKVPILLAGALIWWAVRQEPPLDDGRGEGGDWDRPHPPPRLPHAPRRGPHGEAPLPAPARMRRGVARPRERQR
jgi:hypothetical protein